MGENKNVKYVVRQMQVSDCDQVRDQLWTKLNFLGSIYENQIAMKIDPKSTFVAQDLTTGELMGICSGINISQDMALIGQYCVKPEFQGLGIGSALWRSAIEHIGPERNISLFALEHMFEKYQKRSNFTLCAEKRALRHTGKADCSQLIEAIDGISVLPISEDNIEKVIQYDKQVCDGLDRTVLIKEISQIREYVNAVALNQKEEVLGYCVVKVSNLNTGIVEPLYANDEQIAELLIGNCCRTLTITQTNGLVYPTWNANQRSVAIARKMGLQVTRSSTILFTKKVVEGDTNRIYCISNRCFYPF